MLCQGNPSIFSLIRVQDNTIRFLFSLSWTTLLVQFIRTWVDFYIIFGENMSLTFFLCVVTIKHLYCIFLYAAYKYACESLIILLGVSKINVFIVMCCNPNVMLSIELNCVVCRGLLRFHVFCVCMKSSLIV